MPQRERWKAIPGFEGLYEVSDCGRVKSLQRMVGEGKKRRINRERLLRPKQNSNYREVKLRRDGKQFMKLINVAVLEAYVGPRPRGMECRHLDGDVDNNNLSNLRWGTRAENAADREIHGTMCHGEHHPNSKLTDNAVKIIRTAVGSQQSLASKFGVGQVTISRVKRGLRWRHV